MSLMVMPGNNTGAWVGYLAGKYEGRMGHLYSPGEGRRTLPFLPHHCDNKRYVCFKNGTEWNEREYLVFLDRYGRDAGWCIVPDVVMNRDATLREWDRWAKRLKAEGYTLAMAVQDGMTAADVPSEAEVVCVGGGDEFKHSTIHYWAEHFRRVHVLRINTEKWLWECESAGVESCDGNGWFRGDPVQFRGLLRFLDRSSRGLGPTQGTLFEKSGNAGDSLAEARARIHEADGFERVESTTGPQRICRADERRMGQVRESA